MNVFWKTILTAVVTMAAIVSARWAAQSTSYHLFRSPSAHASMAQVAKPAHAPAHVQSYVPTYGSSAARHVPPRKPYGAPRP